uniref:Uncharacterized protein n=1 Tax=Glossina pallidipes TaxID=7398 RepID=A0A1A9ZEW3_GLOPL
MIRFVTCLSIDRCGRIRNAAKSENCNNLAPEVTPKNLDSHKKAIHPRSPKAVGLSGTVSSVSSSNCIPAATLNSVHSVTMPHTQTPPA